MMVTFYRSHRTKMEHDYNEMELLQTELKKLQEAYDKLQAYVTDVELKQKANDTKSCKENSCTGCHHSLCKYVADLFQNPLHSDVTILMEEGQVIYGHKLILLCRSSQWNGIDINNTDCLDFSDMKYEVVYNMFKWVYTDELDISHQDNLLEMIQLASKFYLKALFIRCEEALKSLVSATNYEDIYRTARKVSANDLKDTCMKMKENICQQDSENSSEIFHKCLDSDKTFLHAEELAEHSKNHSDASLETRLEVLENDVKTEVETCNETLNETKNVELKNQETEKLTEVEVSLEKRPLRTNKSRKAKSSKTSQKAAKSKKNVGTKSCEKKVEIVQEIKCSVCVKIFKTRRKLSNHERTHKRDKIYKCDICSKHFYSIGHYKQHIKVHSELRPFQCDICGATFRQSGGLYSHRSIHTGDKPYKCDECNKSFRMKNCLQTHQRVHSGIKPYICHVCGKGFGSSSHFRRHKVIHTGEKRHQCDVCKKCFQYTHHLKRHLKTHNKTQSQPRLVNINSDKETEIQYPVPSHKLTHNLQFFKTFHINESLRDTVQYIHIDGDEIATE